MLEKHIHRTQTINLFDAYEDATFLQLECGGNATCIKQYEERSGWIVDNILDNHKCKYELTNDIVPTRQSLCILNPSAETSLTNGFGYVQELLMQRNNFYINRCQELLTENGVDVYTAKTDAFTIRQMQLETARCRLNWEDGIGSWWLNQTEM